MSAECPWEVRGGSVGGPGGPWRAAGAPRAGVDPPGPHVHDQKLVPCGHGRTRPAGTAASQRPLFSCFLTTFPAAAQREEGKGGGAAGCLESPRRAPNLLLPRTRFTLPASSTPLICAANRRHLKSELAVASTRLFGCHATPRTVLSCFFLTIFPTHQLFSSCSNGGVRTGVRGRFEGGSIGAGLFGAEEDRKGGNPRIFRGTPRSSRRRWPWRRTPRRTWSRTDTTWRTRRGHGGARRG